MYIDPRADPKTWEKYFKDILRKHYGPANLKDIPDSYGGDFGIECYTFCGHVFQCYLPEQFTDKKKLSDAQKDKIRKDIRKFTVKNVKDFETLFAGMRISRWVLATPEYLDAEMALYCSTKSIDVRKLGLPYIASDFSILLQTEADYRSEVQALQQVSYQLALEFDSVDCEGATHWITDNLKFLENLDLKLPKIAVDDDIGRRKAFLVQKYLEYQNLLDHLRNEWAEVHLKVTKIIDNRTSYLESRFLTDPSKQSHEVIKDEIGKLRSDINNEISTLKNTDLELITWGVIADWLIRCPLDF